ncbi:hypothetical protein Gpo141_00004019 [Globisporangium polare]
MDDAVRWEPMLLQEPDLLVTGHVDVALQLLSVGDDADEEFPMGGAHDLTDNDSEAPSRGMKRASPVSSDASVGTAAAAAADTAATRECESKKRKALRKSTYHVRKEEKSELAKEIETLQARLKHLEAQQSSSTRPLASSKSENALLRESVRCQQLSLATSQCVVSGLLNGEHSNPLSLNHICLGSDWEDRRKTLLEIKGQTIRHACEYVEARSRFLDPLKRHVSEERFETPGGDFCCTQFDVQHFTNVNSVRQVYDVLVSYMYNIEISVSERLGDITTRDDFDMVENSIAHFRFFTTEFGVPVEKHGVLFMEYFDSHELFDGEPCGVVVIDRVEEDELFPYTPQERMRKDVSISIVVRPHWRAKPGTQGEKELVVSMSFGKFIKVHRSECPLATPDVVAKMRENVMGWGGVMISTIRETLSQKQ